LNYNEVVVRKVAKVESNDKVLSYPIFDPILTHFTRLLKPGIFVVSDEILAEKYFKIPHFCSEGTILSFLLLFLFLFLIFLFIYYFILILIFVFYLFIFVFSFLFIYLFIILFLFSFFNYVK